MKPTDRHPPRGPSIGDRVSLSGRIVGIDEAHHRVTLDLVDGTMLASKEGGGRNGP